MLFLVSSDAGAGRSPRRGPRYAAAALALGLGLNGMGLCLCTPEPVKACEADGCCPNSGGHDDSAPATGTSVKAHAPCCAPQMTPSVAARVDDRDILRHTLIVTAATYVAPADELVASTYGPSASSLRFSSPPRTTVLRI